MAVSRDGVGGAEEVAVLPAEQQGNLLWNGGCFPGGQQESFCSCLRTNTAGHCSGSFRRVDLQWSKKMAAFLGQQESFCCCLRTMTAGHCSGSFDCFCSLQAAEGNCFETDTKEVHLLLAAHSASRASCEKI